MADNPRGSIVIAPDGALFNCDHCVPGTEVGNLDEGVVNKELFDASVFPDPVREKCRLCPCLPECTPFRRCPIVLNNCCEVVKEIVTRDVKHALMLKNREDKSDEEKVRIC